MVMLWLQVHVKKKKATRNYSMIIIRDKVLEEARYLTAVAVTTAPER